MYKLVKWTNLSLTHILTTIFLSISLVIFYFSLIIASRGTDKSPSVNTFAHGGYYCSWDSAYFHFWDEHIDWMTVAGTAHYPYATRNQPLGMYMLCISAYEGSSDYNNLRAYFDSLGIHKDSAFAHLEKNTYQLVGGPGRLVPGWNPSQNDLNNNWVRDYKADYDWNGAEATNFTVQRTSSPYYIEDAFGGKAGTWTINEWKRDYVKLGWNGNADTVSYRVDSNSTSRIYLPSQPPSHTYLWFIVDDSAAPDHNAVAMTDSVAHMNYWAWGCVVYNVNHPRVRNWVGRRFHQEITRICAEYKPPGWLYIDDIMSVGYPWEGMGVVMGGKSLEDYEHNWVAKQKAVVDELKDSVGNGVVYANMANWTNPNYDTICSSLNGMWHEFFIESTDPNGTVIDRFNCLKRMRSAPWNIRVHFLHATASSAYGDVNRTKIHHLAEYYIMKDDSTYYLYDTDGAYGVELCDSTNWWYGLMGVDIGMPTDTAIEALENGVYVWRRPFTKGYVILKPRPGDNANYTDVTTHTLPKYYYKLDVNGDFACGDSINQVSLKNTEGAILLSTDSIKCSSLLKAPTPVSPPNGITIDTTQPTLKVIKVQDSQGRPLLFDFELDTSTKFNTQLKMESTPFELETGSDTIRWTVPTKLSPGIYDWRCQAYVATDSSIRSPQSPVYNFVVGGLLPQGGSNPKIHVIPQPFEPSHGNDFMTFKNIPLDSRITIVTQSGEVVRKLVNNNSTDVIWDGKNFQGRDVASGVYYYVVEFPSGSSSGKLTIIR